MSRTGLLLESALRLRAQGAPGLLSEVLAALFSVLRLHEGVWAEGPFLGNHRASERVCPFSKFKGPSYLPETELSVKPCQAA